jgi:hypothetical protein
MVALAKRMVEKGVWEKFYMWSMKQYKDSFYLNWNMVGEHEVSAWLLTDPERFCRLVWESGVWKEESHETRNT